MKKRKFKILGLIFGILLSSIIVYESSIFSNNQNIEKTSLTNNKLLAVSNLTYYKCTTCTEYLVEQGKLLKEYKWYLPNDDGYQFNWSVLNKPDEYSPCGTLQKKSYNKCYVEKVGNDFTYYASSKCNKSTVTYSSTNKSSCTVQTANSCSSIPNSICQNYSGCQTSGNSCISKTSSTATNYVISIERDGGTLGSSDFTYASDGGIGSYTYNKKTTDSSVSVKIPTTGTKSGYTFGGIYTAKNCSGTKVSSTVTIKSTEQYKTFYACWKSNSGPTTKATTKKATTKSTTKGQTTTKPPVDVPKAEVPIETVDAIRFAYDGASASGSAVSCGDEVHVTTCDASRTDSSTCTIDAINGVKLKTETKVYRQKLVEDYNELPCQITTRYTNKEIDYYTKEADIEKTSAGKIPCQTAFNFTGKITLSCIYGPMVANSVDTSVGKNGTGSYCKVNYKNQDVYVKRDSLSTNPTQTCAEETETCEDSKKITDVKDKPVQVKICGASNARVSQLYSCAEGYSHKMTSSEEDTCGNGFDEPKNCYRTYNVSCQSGVRPGISISGSLVNADGMGTIYIQGRDTGSGVSSYFISQKETADLNSDWKEFEDKTNYTYSYIAPAGTYFAWVKSNNGIISYSAFGVIHDTDISTTLANVEVKDANGTVTSMKALDSATGYNNGIVDSRYVRLSNTLKNNTVLAGFDSLSMGYEVTVKSNKLAVYATLTSTDASYVEGFEPRTVDLDYGRNVILIKIKNNKGKERTYTIIANREDDRVSNNLLSDLTISSGKLDFDSYVSNYDVVVPKNTKSIKINGTLASETASFVKGYEPREVSLDNEITSVILKTISEAGITRSYVVTFTKKGAEDTNKVSNSTYLTSLSIAGTGLEFDKTTYNYSVSIPYELTQVSVYAFAESANATVKIEGDRGLKVGSNNLEITVTNGSKTKVYNVTVVRKQDGLGVSNDIKLNTLTVKDYNINFNPDVLDYVVKIKREKSLVITASPNSNRSDVYMYGNNDLTGFSTVRVKVIAENGDTGIYSIDIQKDSYNKAIEITAAIIGGVIIIGAGIIIVIRKKRKKLKEYVGE